MVEPANEYRVGMSFTLRGTGQPALWSGQNVSIGSGLQMPARERAALSALDEAWERFSALLDKANSLLGSGQPAALSDAISTFTKAIETLPSNIEALANEQKNTLAAAYVHRGIAKRFSVEHGPDAAIGDYDAAIALMAALRRELEPTGEWHSLFRHDLAAAYMNRGIAKQLATGHGPAAAIADCDAAIKLMETLKCELEPRNQWNSEHRSGLAEAYMNRGRAKERVAGHGPIAAIADYDAAIEIKEALCREVEPNGAMHLQLRNQLAKMYMNRGVAKAKATGHGPAAAIVDHDAAIELMLGLRRNLEPHRAWSPPLRDELASAYVNRGNAKIEAAGHGPEAAIADYEAAILLREELRRELQLGDAWDPEFREQLAAAYLSRGNAKLLAPWHEVGEVILDYDAAIELRKALREELEPRNRWPPDLRNSLAQTYLNRGTAKQWAGLGSEAAEADCQRALALVEPLLADHGRFFAPAVEVRLSATLLLVDVLRASQRPDEGTDAADEGLRFARFAEQLGVSWYRMRRERLFAAALDTYRAAGLSHFLPEVIFDDLDPAVPGSAVDSPAMHGSATAALADELARVWRPDTAANWAQQKKLLAAQARLATLQTGRFAGSATLARLNATVEAAAGRLNEAERILARQVTWRPQDPEGFVVRADFLAEQGRREEARQDLLHAARLSAKLIGPPTPENVVAVAALGAQILLLHLADIAADPTRSDPAQARAFRDRFRQLTRWLFDRLPSEVLEPLPPALREMWRQPLLAALAARQMQVDRLHETIIAEQEQRWRGDIRARIAAEWSASHRDVMALIRSVVPMPWSEFVQGILFALETAQTQFAGLSETERDIAIADALLTALRAETERLEEATLRDDMARLTQLLGPQAAALTDLERRFLAASARCAAQSDMEKFAVLELSCGVEWSLLDRLLRPLRTALREGWYCYPIPPAEADRDKLAAYLMNQRDFLVLGEMVRGYTEASKHVGESVFPPGACGAIASWIARQPNPSALYMISSERAKKRRAALHVLSQARNTVAHPKPGADGAPMPAPALAPHWEALVADPEDAFFRYFPKVFLTPSSSISA